MPKLSIVTPCYNLGAYLRDCIKSVEALPAGLAEHIIIDDCSTDASTQAIIAQLQSEGKQTVLRNEQNRELANTLNRGIAAANGEYILVLSADDALEPRGIEAAIQWLETHSEYQIVYGDTQMFGDREGFLPARPFNLELLMVDNFILASAVYRRKVWEKVGGYDPGAPYMAFEDWEFWLGAARAGYSFHYLPIPMLRYRVLSTSKSRTISIQKAKVNAMMDYVYDKYRGFTGAQELDDFIVHRLKTNPIAFFAKWILRAYFPSAFRHLCEKGRFRKYL